MCVLYSSLPKCSFMFCSHGHLPRKSCTFSLLRHRPGSVCAGLIWAPVWPWGSPISDGAVVGHRQAVCFPVSLLSQPSAQLFCSLGLGGEVGVVFLCMRDGQVGIYDSLENKLFPGDKAIPPLPRSYSGSFPRPC